MISPIALPASLTQQFDSLERRLWRMDALLAVSGAAGSLLASYLLLYAADRVCDTPVWLRFALALAGWTGFAVFAWRYGNKWVWGRRSVRALAVIVQKRYRRLGDRLLGIVELADPDCAAVELLAGAVPGGDRASGRGGVTRSTSSRRRGTGVRGGMCIGFLALAALARRWQR